MTGPASPGTQPRTKKVLIAEDEASIVMSLEFLLKAAGYEVTVALDGAAALRLMPAVHPDLVVLDVMLPSVSGFEVCRRIRDERAFKDTRILMLTARGRENEIAKGMAAGANAYMTKPFATRELMRVVGELLASNIETEDQRPGARDPRRGTGFY